MAIFHLAFGYVTLFLLLKKLLPKLKLSLKVLLAVLIVNLMILSQIAFLTFYWGCTVWYISINYFLILLLLLIFSSEYQKKYTYLVIVLFSTIIGSFSETYSPLVILCLGVVWLFSFYKKNLLSKTTKSRLFVSLIVLSVSFIILLIAPGNKVRIQELGGELPSLDLFFIRKTVSLFPDFMFFILSKIYYLLLLFPLFVVLGSRYKKMKTESFFLKKMNFKYFLFSLLGLFLFLYVAEAPGVYAMRVELAPMRTFSFLPFIFAFFFSFWGLVVGYNSKKENIFFSVLYTLFLLLIIGTVGNKLKQDLPVVKDYKASITELHQTIKENKEKGRTEALKVMPIVVPQRLSNFSILYNNTIVKLGLKKPKMYYDFCYMRYYLSPNSTDWKNQGLKEYFELNYDIIGWDREVLLYIE